MFNCDFISTLEVICLVLVGSYVCVAAANAVN